MKRSRLLFFFLCTFPLQGLLWAEEYCERLGSLIPGLCLCQEQCSHLVADSELQGEDAVFPFMRAMENRLLATSQLVKALRVVAWALDSRDFWVPQNSGEFIRFFRAFSRNFKAYVHGELTGNEFVAFTQQYIADSLATEAFAVLLEELWPQHNAGFDENAAAVFDLEPEDVATQRPELVHAPFPQRQMGADVRAFAFYFEAQTARRNVQPDRLMRTLLTHLAEVPFQAHVELAGLVLRYRRTTEDRMPEQAGYAADGNDIEPGLPGENDVGNADEEEEPGDHNGAAHDFGINAFYGLVQQWLQAFYAIVGGQMPSAHQVRLSPRSLVDSFERNLEDQSNSEDLPSPREAPHSPESIFVVPDNAASGNMGLGIYYGFPCHRRGFSASMVSHL